MAKGQDKIKWARSVLSLGDRATLKEIKKSYRRLAKKAHPDMLNQIARESDSGKAMRELKEAYDILLDFCTHYPIPLEVNSGDEVDVEKWWYDRFGQDPLWGRGEK